MELKQIGLVILTIGVLFGLWYLFNFLGSYGFSFSVILAAAFGLGVVMCGLLLYFFVSSTLKMKL